MTLHKKREREAFQKNLSFLSSKFAEIIKSYDREAKRARHKESFQTAKL
jgi:hypothetical protein